MKQLQRLLTFTGDDAYGLLVITGLLLMMQLRITVNSKKDLNGDIIL